MIEEMTETDCHPVRTEEEGAGGTADHPGTTAGHHQGMTVDHHPGMTADLQLETRGETKSLPVTEDLTIEIYALIRKKWVDYRERETGREAHHPEMIEGVGLGDLEVHTIFHMTALNLFCTA